MNIYAEINLIESVALKLAITKTQKKMFGRLTKTFMKKILQNRIREIKINNNKSTKNCLIVQRALHKRFVVFF